jgi:hypothetical protein
MVTTHTGNLTPVSWTRFRGSAIPLEDVYAFIFNQQGFMKGAGIQGLKIK